MARVENLRLKVTTDSSDAIELVPRVESAVTSTLTAAGLAVTDAVAASVTAEVMAEIIRIRQATPEESAQARAIERVRALHRQEYGACDWCSTNDRHVAWPCPTARALDGEEQPSV